MTAVPTPQAGRRVPVMSVRKLTHQAALLRMLARAVARGALAATPRNEADERLTSLPGEEKDHAA